MIIHQPDGLNSRTCEDFDRNQKRNTPIVFETPNLINFLWDLDFITAIKKKDEISASRISGGKIPGVSKI